MDHRAATADLHAVAAADDAMDLAVTNSAGLASEDSATWAVASTDPL